MADRSIVEAREPFSVTLPNGTPFMVARGDRFYSDDPLVKGRENLFGELKVRSTQQQDNRSTETATAAPGERRTVTPPDLDALRAEAEGAGVTVDKRWGPDRLRQEIDAKRKAQS